MKPSKKFRPFLRLSLFSAVALSLSGCQVDPAAFDQALSAVSQYGGGYLPSEARTAISVVRQLNAIAQYKASQSQIAQAKAKAKSSSSSSSTRQYVRVKPDKSSGTSSKGTHLVEYNPKTDKVGTKVVVVPETNLKKGESVAINGKSGNII